MSDFKVSVNGLAAEVSMFKFSGGELKTVFRNGELTKFTTLAEIRERIDSTF